MTYPQSLQIFTLLHVSAWRNSLLVDGQRLLHELLILSNIRCLPLLGLLSLPGLWSLRSLASLWILRRHRSWYSVLYGRASHRRLTSLLWEVSNRLYESILNHPATRRLGLSELLLVLGLHLDIAHLSVNPSSSSRLHSLLTTWWCDILVDRSIHLRILLLLVLLRIGCYNKVYVVSFDEVTCG